jgi:hypothetical protein
MKASVRAALLVSCVWVAGGLAVANTVTETADKVGSAASAVVTKTGKAIESGAQAAASGVEKGVKATARAVKRGASAAATGVQRGASAAATGVQRGASAAAHYFSADHEQFRAACATSWRARSRPFVTPGTKPAPSRASCTARPPRSGCWASATPKRSAARRPTCSTPDRAAEETGAAGAGRRAASLGRTPSAAAGGLAFGSEALKQRVIPPVLAGEKIAALAITEPSAAATWRR